MRKLLSLLILTLFSAGVFAAEYSSTFSTITTNSTMITDVTGTIAMNEDWNGNATLRTTSAVLQDLYDQSGNVILDPNTGEPLIGLVETTFSREETNLVGNNKIEGGTFGYTSTAISSGLGHKVDSNGVGSGGGFRTTEIITSLHTGQTILETTVTGDSTQTDTATTWVDFDGVGYDLVYDTEVSFSTKTFDSTDFTRDLDTTYNVNILSTSKTVIDEWYSSAYNNVYK